MEISEQIAKLEKNSPMRYLDYQLTSWGRMYSDMDNKESYTSNYAVIDKNENIDDIIKEIEEYYNSKNIIPKIFYRHGSLELDVLRPYYEKYGYSIREFDIDLMILNMNDAINNKIKGCKIRRVGHVLDGKEYNLVLEQDDGETYGIKLLNKQIAAGNNMFFAYNEACCPVSMALAEKYNNTVYISNVYTTPSNRCQGYGMAVIDAVISYYKDSFIYLHTHNPDAASVYRKLGFTGETFKSWWAVKGSLPEWCQ
ncbi:MULTISPECIES: GNAT family N-acetyltransferase [unclassified Sedimentibacter]|uniref:GNAT family N-acetyltransferase n=1 Tax=unclassified Sedimentibacter TaxID=2649220 RepID=UPI0027E1B9FF|nr:GNAT family N-acetyltransferase [Sedimentibacter sp. MB35-C1]WMJ75706.1 GNAT family N-acetyltransferase [Sedimentibacter sp. MB35-C1]